MNEPDATCGACSRVRPRHYLDTVTITVVKNGEEMEQATLLLACKDAPGCGERLRHRLEQGQPTREK